MKATPWGRIIVWTVVLLATVGVGRTAAPEIGAPAPAWKLSGTDGASWSSDELLGHVVVLEFWATWCPRCRANMPEVARLIRDYADRPVRVIAVNILENGDPVAYMKDKGGQIPFALEGDEVAARLGVAGTPTAVVIDSEGRLAARLAGAGEARTEQLRETLDALLDPSR